VDLVASLDAQLGHEDSLYTANQVAPLDKVSARSQSRGRKIGDEKRSVEVSAAAGCFCGPAQDIRVGEMHALVE
jgi:hypothetical protein